MPVAFPGAEGYGRNAVGGRGGTLYIVSNLNDSGSGSFRLAAEAAGTRIVVFTTGGTISVASTITIDDPNITIAGQTAPGGGITLKADASFAGGILRVDASQVIMRYIRIRRGEHTATGSQGDGMTVGPAAGSISNLIFDHCSFSWGVDENVGQWYDVSNVTYQWCIISEALHNSTHTDGAHSMGLLLGNASDTSSVLRCLMAHNDQRGPRIHNSGESAGTFEVVNNVEYNSGEPASVGGWAPAHVSNGSHVNFIGNYCKAGADTVDPSYYISTSSTPGDIYVLGNIATDRPTDTGDEDLVVRAADRGDVVGTPLSTPSITRWSPTRAYTEVLADVGMSRSIDPDGTWRSNRDSVDDRIISDVEDGTGSIIDNEDDVGGWPTLDAGTAPTDTDSDGMPDEWEDLHGLDKNSASDMNSYTAGNGYTNIENFINGIPILEHGGPASL